jgi:chromosomal replication initiation ATPase DnaA
VAVEEQEEYIGVLNTYFRKSFSRPEAIQFEESLRCCSIVFVTGGAGCGKSHLLQAWQPQVDRLFLNSLAYE